MNRRQFLATAAAALPAFAFAADKPMPGTRGVVLYPFDLTLADWPERAKRAGLTTIGLHAARRFDVLRDFIAGTDGRRFMAKCDKLGIAVEYELHAMGELLSRELYYKDPTLFRMDEAGGRELLPAVACRARHHRGEGCRMGTHFPPDDPSLFLLAGRWGAVVSLRQVPRFFRERTGVAGGKSHPPRAAGARCEGQACTHQLPPHTRRTQAREA